MEKLLEVSIYVVYPLLLLTLLWGCRVSKKGQWNEEAFSLRQMKAMQGFAALCIMMHHCGQRTSASWIDKKYYVGGLEFFVPIGFILVSFFTFCSGYGLYKSFKTKDGYLKNHFIRKRIVPIVVLGYAIALIFLVVRVLLGENMGGGMLAFYLLRLKLCNPNEWYVLVIPFFYLVFYLAFGHIKNEKKALIAVFVFTVCYQLLGTSLDHNDWWMRGEWWYNSVHMFPVGILFAMNEDKIVGHLCRNYKKYIVIGFIAIIVSDIVRTFVTGVVSYYGEYWDAPDRIPRRMICLCSEMFEAFVVVFYGFLLGLKIKIGNRVLTLMGKITLEFYLIHGLFIGLFSYNFDGELRSLYYVRNSTLFVVIVFVLGLASALILKKASEVIKKLLT